MDHVKARFVISAPDNHGVIRPCNLVITGGRSGKNCLKYDEQDQNAVNEP